MRTVRRRGVLNVSAGASGGSRCAVSCGDDHVADLVGEAGQPRRGQLLAAELEQQLAIHRYRPSATATAALRNAVSSTYAFAIPTAS